MQSRLVSIAVRYTYPSMPHSLIQNVLCGKDTTASAIREVFLDHIFRCSQPAHAVTIVQSACCDILLTVKKPVIISSTGSWQVRYVSPDVATLLCIGTSHDRKGSTASPYAQQERDILTREDKKDQNDPVLAHDSDTVSDPGAYFFL